MLALLEQDRKLGRKNCQTVEQTHTICNVRTVPFSVSKRGRVNGRKQEGCLFCGFSARFRGVDIRYDGVAGGEQHTTIDKRAGGKMVRVCPSRGRIVRLVTQSSVLSRGRRERKKERKMKSRSRSQEEKAGPGPSKQILPGMRCMGTR